MFLDEYNYSPSDSQTFKKILLNNALQLKSFSSTLRNVLYINTFLEPISPFVHKIYKIVFVGSYCPFLNKRGGGGCYFLTVWAAVTMSSQLIKHVQIFSSSSSANLHPLVALWIHGPTFSFPFRFKVFSLFYSILFFSFSFPQSTPQHSVCCWVNTKRRARGGTCVPGLIPSCYSFPHPNSCYLFVPKRLLALLCLILYSEWWQVMEKK